MAEFHLFLDFDEPTPGIVVPQRVYSVHGPSDCRRIPNITFRMNGALGMRLQDALDLFATHGGIPGLDGAHSTPRVTESGRRSTLRIIWPGYELWSDPNSIHQFDHRQRLNPRPLEFIAHQVARSIRSFYDVTRNVRGTEPGWQISRYQFGDFYLLELRHVSSGSWQPVIALCVNM